MKILSVNAGSSSLKFSLFEFPMGNELINGYFEKVGLNNSFYTIKINGDKIKREVSLKNHSECIKYLTEELISNKVIDSMDDIDGIGHRVVHGGDFYHKSELISDGLIERVRSLNHLAPLHNPANIVGIEAFRENIKGIPNVAVFDTAFHQTMKESEYIYPLPYEWYEKHKIRKYGFHGTSHRYIDKKISEYLKRDDLKIISCHVGSGASVCAINAHESIDTSLGFTPLPGVMMGTRCGDIDPSIIPFIMEKEDLNINEVMDILNKKSGLLALSGISSDARDIEMGIEKGNERCILAYDKMTRTIANYIAMYNNILDGADVICFTAGLGEKSEIMRGMVMDKIKSLGVSKDTSRNKAFGEFALISSDESKIPVYVVPTNEELMIAIDTYELMS